MADDPKIVSGVPYDVDPPLPDGPDPVEADTKYVLELYAEEIREHASGIVHIYGLWPSAVEEYKAACFDAADSLDAAAQILRQNNRLTKVVILKAEPAVSVPVVQTAPPEVAAAVASGAAEPPPVLPSATRKTGWAALLGKLFTPCMAALAVSGWVLHCHPQLAGALDRLVGR